ncbi:hypothetical protein TSUD_134930 [Trifolium subterraneum]|uniref:DUF4283 domain protein n=1 Tax=Trifolium subterraneum TaxID=3900 RepID=A0A2Z6LYI1_TRISU|nr:hypothetical protein TSUD_134930 [Trifolium subterraneum]
MADGLEVEDVLRSQVNLNTLDSRVDAVARSKEVDLVIPTPAGEAGEICSDMVLSHPVGSVVLVPGISNSPIVSGDQGSMSICSPVVGLRSPVGEKGQEVLRSSPLRNSRTKSCPPGVNRSMLSGPWSLDWLHDHNHGDAGVIFSARKKPLARARAGAGHKKGGQDAVKRRKAGGVFRHTLSSLKKVARLPSKDRSEVLKVLKIT